MLDLQLFRFRLSQVTCQAEKGLKLHTAFVSAIRLVIYISGGTSELFVPEKEGREGDSAEE